MKREVVCEQMDAQVVAEVVMDAEPQGQETGGTESVVAQVVMDGNAEPSEEDVTPEDIVILHHTLVQGGALPAESEREFSTLARAIARAAAREQNRMARSGNVEAAVWLHDREKRKHEEQLVEQQTAAQFQWAASERPRRFRTRLEKSQGKTPLQGRAAEMVARSGRLGAPLAHSYGAAPGGATEQRESLGRRQACVLRCGHVCEPSGSSSTGPTSPTASSTSSRYSPTQNACGCGCQNRERVTLWYF